MQQSFKKNRYVAWTGNEKEEPVIKGLDGLSDSNPLWVRKWFKKIVVELVKHPETRFEVIIRMIKEAFDELDSDRISREEDLKFTQILSKDAHEYKGHSRPKILAETLDKGKGELVHWYGGYEDICVESKRCWIRKRSYPTKPQNLNLDEYKKLLLRKLKDSLEITGFHTTSLERELLEPDTKSDMAMFLPGVELQR